MVELSNEGGPKQLVIEVGAKFKWRPEIWKEDLRPFCLICQIIGIKSISSPYK